MKSIKIMINNYKHSINIENGTFTTLIDANLYLTCLRNNKIIEEIN